MNAYPFSCWTGRFNRLATRIFGADTAAHWLERYQPLFSDDYQALVPPRDALQDVLQLEQLPDADNQRVSLLRPSGQTPHFRLHFYSRRQRYLDEYLPLLANAGLRVMDQVQFRLTATDGGDSYIKSFYISPTKDSPQRLRKLRKPLLGTLQAMMDARTEHDALNKLCVLAGLAWQEIDVLRAYRNYFLQIAPHSSRLSFHHALLHHPEITRILFDYFEARFRPEAAWQDLLVREDQALMPLRCQLPGLLEGITDSNDDRILRTLFNLIDATMRCNFHQRRTADEFYIAFKINSLGVIDLPSPRPQFEIFVHAEDMQGCHLRGGKISRGGIRWSDRPDDFRTEILDLMQTQISKNALIIPTGAKGGFVLKKNGGHSDLKTLGKAAYRKLICGLLDLTDNLVDGQPVTPPGLVVYDDPDPYLVVAADKGTATFSDFANQIAADYQFWLGDAFASGGSHGYDHKALGITARGAWECVKHHFRELGRDCQREPFNVIGIGSMDGDVFGNGMLLSPMIRLQAAFSGQHIFLDPNPGDLPGALAERQRLFNLPGSSWDDYDRTLLSTGGGVYPRTAQAIPLSPETQAWLGLRHKNVDGDTLIRALLCAETDLLWLGGIGTYVKASSESHEDVGDRSNDAVRVNANELRAKIVGEGANLGFTQKARVEFALRGGLINTDAVDNSAGVDTSDHEVNLKILLAGLKRRGLADDHQAAFTAATDEVCELVLANNRAQSLCLSLEEQRLKDGPDDWLLLAERLVAAGFLDKTVESFPSDKTVCARPQKNLTRPELAVLLAASKRQLTAQLKGSALIADDDACGELLPAYFPGSLRLAYAPYLAAHPLAQDIKATMVSNKILNQTGCRFLVWAENHGGLLAAVSTYLAFERIFDADQIRADITGLSGPVAVHQQYPLWLAIEKALLACCHWALAISQPPRPDANSVAAYRAHLQVCQTFFAQTVRDTALQYAAQAPIPDPLAETIAMLAKLAELPLWVSLAENSGQPLHSVLGVYQEVQTSLGLGAFQAHLAQVPTHDHWERAVVAGLQQTLSQTTGKLCGQILASRAQDCADYLALTNRETALSEYRAVYQEVLHQPAAKLAPLVVLSKCLALVAD